MAETNGDTVQKRQVAKKVMVKDLTLGKYVVEEGWKPNYVATQYGKVSRSNVMASVVAKADNSITVDDGSANLVLRWFEDNPHFSTFIPGDMINIIGRPRQYNDGIYVVPEIIKKIEDPMWIKVHRKEMEEQPKETIEVPQVKKEVFTEEKIEESKDNPADKLVNLIKELDTDDGADIDEVIERSNVPGAEDQIKRLMEEGDVFEIRPGRLKVLE